MQGRTAVERCCPSPLAPLQRCPRHHQNRSDAHPSPSVARTAGVNLYMQGAIDRDALGEIVDEKMAKLVGMGGDMERFGEWLQDDEGEE
eukprot:6325351-Prymnesium_polylepis.1